VSNVTDRNGKEINENDSVETIGGMTYTVMFLNEDDNVMILAEETNSIDDGIVQVPYNWSNWLIKKEDCQDS
jgi:formylmethanofuran dehydrogenase subunit D